MRSHRVAVGLLLLLVAGALGVGSLHDTSPSKANREPAPFRSASSPAEQRLHQQIAAGHTTAHPAHLHRVEPLPPASAEDLAQARQTEAAARKRLAELTEQLALSADQQNKIFPLLVRASPHYDESLRLVGQQQHPGGPLNRIAADELLHALLDPYQQVELELGEAEKELWWSDVISRLEEDLHNATQPDQLPAAGSPPPPPAHGGGNIFDLLNEDTP